MLSKIVKCETCKYYDIYNDKNYATCKVFPEGIPPEIFREDVDHKKPYPGDNGIQYEPIDE